MARDREERSEYDRIVREVVALRSRVAELQRTAARHEDTEGISLPEREELLREAERVAHLGTWTWDLGSGRVTWSDELYRILGLELGSVTPSVEGFFAAVHPEDRERAQAAGQQSIRDGVLPPVDCRIVRRDGSVRHTTNSCSMLFDGQGTVRRWVGAVLDRTDSLDVETQLRRALALLEEAQRFAQLGSWRFDPERGVLEWSQEFRRIAGLTADEVPNVGRFMERVVPEDRSRFLDGRVKSLSLAMGGQIEGRLQRPDGEIRHVRLNAYQLETDDGSRELRGTTLDVTDQVRLREELAHAQKMEAVGRLAGGIAHDFNNLLTVITGNLELLTLRIGSARELDNSFQALSSAAALTRRLLSFGRKAQLSLKLVAPNTLVCSTIALMNRLVGDEVRLVLELAPELPQVRVDVLEMERALVNLVANARDAMPGGGAVRVGTGARRVDGVLSVEFSVGDEGAGIAEVDRPHIFEPFFTTREHAGGTGLGLATVLGTAEQHGGTVRVEPRTGGGTVFTIVLPAVESDVHVEDGSVESVAEQGDGQALQLLVIDDEEHVADVTRRMLESRGHLVRVASRPEQAFQVWSEHGRDIDLVICDVVMAHMRGPELITALARSGVNPRVLFITGYSEEAAGSGLGHPVLAKPFSAVALCRAYRDALAN